MEIPAAHLLLLLLAAPGSTSLTLQLVSEDMKHTTDLSTHLAKEMAEVVLVPPGGVPTSCAASFLWPRS